VTELLKIRRYEARAAECEMFAALATDRFERDVYMRVAGHFREFAAMLASSLDAPKAALPPSASATIQLRPIPL
jgi:hypothetical protein